MTGIQDDSWFKRADEKKEDHSMLTKRNSRDTFSKPVFTGTFLTRGKDKQ